MSKPIGRKPTEMIADVIIIIAMLALMFITVYPLLYTLFASFSDAKSLLKVEGPLWGPLPPYTLRGYELTFQNAKLGVSVLNTLFYVLVGTFMGLIITGMAAFVLSRKNFMLKNIIMKLIMFTMFFSGGIIPLFFVVRNIGIYDTRWAFLLPWAMSAYNMIIMRTFFLGIPESLEESATLDGATDLQIFFRIYVPLSTAVIAVIAMYYGVAWWNSWYQSLVFQPTNTLWPLQMILREVLITNTKSATTDVTSMAEESYTRELVKYCTVVVSTVPILVIYPFLQRYFVKGVMIGAVKG
ncbi:MAG: carbohydrate ABC transporter permease [Candidatus Fimadaptatus sp.]